MIAVTCSLSTSSPPFCRHLDRIQGRPRHEV